MLPGDVADELHNDDRLAHSRPTVGADLAALGERGDQVQHLDAGLQYLRGGGLLFVGRRLSVDRPPLLRDHLAQAVQRLAGHVEQAAQRRRAHGHGDGLTGVDDLSAPCHPLRGAKRQAPDSVVPYVLLYLQDQPLPIQLQLQSAVQRR